MTGKTMPEAVAQANNLYRGWQKYYNYDTLKGRYGVFIACMGVYYAVYKVVSVKYNRPKVLAERQAIQDKKDLFDRQVQAWVKNGRKFD